MDLRIGHIDGAIIANINGVDIGNIVDYKITTSAHDGTEVELRIKIDDSVTELTSSTN